MAVASPLFYGMDLLRSVEAFIGSADKQRTAMQTLERGLVIRGNLHFTNIRAEPNRDRWISKSG
jgi:hypothetical protein